MNARFLLRSAFVLALPLAALAAACSSITGLDQAAEAGIFANPQPLRADASVYLPPREFAEVETDSRVKFVIPPEAQAYYARSFDRMTALFNLNADRITTRTQRSYNIRDNVIHVFKEKKYVEVWFCKSETDYWIIFKVPTDAYNAVFLKFDEGASDV